MTQQPEAQRPSRLERLRTRLRDRRELMADRRARRNWGNPYDEVNKAEAKAWESGGFFTKNTKPRP